MFIDLTGDPHAALALFNHMPLSHVIVLLTEVAYMPTDEEEFTRGEGGRGMTPAAIRAQIEEATEELKKRGFVRR